MKISAYYLHTLQHRINTVGHNLANSNTIGFKETLQSLEEANDHRELSNSQALFGGIPPGLGALNDNNAYRGQRIDFSQGALWSTGNPFDLAIEGEGFFQVRTPDGRIGYSRAGVFSPNGQGELINNQGMALVPGIRIPDKTSQIEISPDGLVTGEGEDGSRVELGRILLAIFPNPQGLDQAGENIYLATAASGEAVSGNPGSGNLGTIKGETLEKSNADLANGITQLIKAQRSYQFKLRAIKNQDEMFQQAITMRG